MLRTGFVLLLNLSPSLTDVITHLSHPIVRSLLMRPASFHPESSAMEPLSLTLFDRSEPKRSPRHVVAFTCIVRRCSVKPVWRARPLALPYVISTISAVLDPPDRPPILR